MSRRSCSVYALLSCLAIGIGLCQTASVKKIRTVRDTRDIPSDLFKPLGSTTNTQANSAHQTNGNTDDAFSVRSTGEAHVIDHPSAPNAKYEQSSQEDEFQSGISRMPNNFIGPGRSQYPSTFRTGQYRPVYYYSGPQNNVYQPLSKFGPSGFPSSSASGPGGFGSSAPLISQTVPLITSGYTDFEPIHTPGGRSGFGGGSSSNFYRLESYSYSSDGNGSPQVERNVYDSRVGHGLKSRNF